MIKQIEREYGRPAKIILKEFGEEFGVRQTAQILEQPFSSINYYFKKYNIKIAYRSRNSVMPHYEDVCIQKYGISLKAYLNTRCRWMTTQEMAQDLETNNYTISWLLAKENLIRLTKWRFFYRRQV